MLSVRSVCAPACRMYYHVCFCVHWTELKRRSLSKTTKRICANRFELQTVKSGCLLIILIQGGSETKTYCLYHSSVLISSNIVSAYLNIVLFWMTPEFYFLKSTSSDAQRCRVVHGSILCDPTQPISWLTQPSPTHYNWKNLDPIRPNPILTVIG